jgi:octaheme c-type cytochrome (tetrathionate reductase family)
MTHSTLRRRAVHSVFVLLLAAASPALAQTPPAPSAEPAPQTAVIPRGQSTADHSKFVQLKKRFKTGEEVTDACLSCHTEAAKQVMATKHWTWDFKQVETAQTLGKKNVLNAFCIGLRSNEAFCTACHVGYGWKDDKFDFSSERNVDCLVCHDTSGKYKKIPGLAGHPNYTPMEFPPQSGKILPPVDLETVVRHVGKTRRENCGVCHFYGGGGDGVKHGDLDSSLNQPDRALDVHMDKNGLNFACATCHQTDSHRVAGSRYAPTASDPHGPIMRGKHGERNPATCQACHGDRPHDARHAKLNDHTRRLACQTCHIPAYARGGVPTKLSWDWSTAGRLTADGKPIVTKDAQGHVVYDSKKGSFTFGENVVPDYLWFDGTVKYVMSDEKIDPARTVRINRFAGGADDPDSRIWPVKIFHGKQPYDTVYQTLLNPHTWGPDDYASLWTNFDWKKSLEYGMTATGRPYSGEYAFVQSEMTWPITHMVAPAERALRCVECHSRQGRLHGIEGIYIPGRDRSVGLDTTGYTLAGLALLGVIGHGALRVLTRRQRKEP